MEPFPIISNKKEYDKDSSSQLIISYLKKYFGKLEGRCYYRKLLYDNGSGFCPDITIISKEYGILLFKCYEYTANVVNEISSNYWIINNELIKKDFLNFKDYYYLFNSDINRPSYGLQNKINISNYICFPFLERNSEVMASESSIGNYFYSDMNKKNILDTLEKNQINEKEWNNLLNVVQGLQSLKKHIGIHIDDPPKNLGEAIIKREQHTAVYDMNQEIAASQIPENGFRIRGIAGTGKTILLTAKAAHLHRLYPNKKIVYTFFTKSLYNQIRKFIINFYNKYSDRFEEPNWDNLQILHAWGGKSRNGVYYDTCIRNKVKPRNAYELRLFKDRFGYACSDLLRKKKEFKEVYDYVLIDEAQDMPTSFFRVVAKITKPPKIIGIAYDELQNTENVRMPKFEELFGYDKQKKPLINLEPENDHILRVSYRNDGRILNLALALGLGLYDKVGGINQIIDTKENWHATGYKIIKGNMNFNEKHIIKRPKDNSPIDVTNIFERISPVNFKSFETRTEELNFVSDKIVEFVKEENVKPEDIIVISLNKNIKSDYRHIQARLFSSKINSKIPGIIDAGDDFFIEGNVTLSSLRRSKGNEAPIVFLIGINNIVDFSDKVKVREKRSFSFVSLTRAKGWCFISGSGSNMDHVNQEIQSILNDYPHFSFNFPDEEEYNEIKQINYYTEDEESKKEYYEGLEAIKKYVRKDQYLPEEIKQLLKKYVEEENDDK